MCLFADGLGPYVLTVAGLDLDLRFRNSDHVRAYARFRGEEKKGKMACASAEGKAMRLE